MTRRTPTTAAAITLGAALLLSACGGGDSGSDEIAGADDSSKSSSASASPSPDTARPDLSLPEDFEIVFDFEKPSNPDHAAALANAENYIRALKHGISEQNPNDPAYQFYSTDGAKRYAKRQIEDWVEGGWTIYGKDRYYRARIDSIDAGVLVTFCRNQAKSYGKKVDTGKVRYTEESLNSYQEFQILMQEDSKIWKARSIEVWGKSKECRT